MTGPSTEAAPIEQALAAWPGLALTGRPAGGARSDLHLGELDGRRVVVRRSRREEAALDWQLDLMDHLAEQGVGVAPRIPAGDGRRHVDGVWVEAFLEGRPPADEDDWAATAAAIARVHEVTTDWPQRPGFLDAASLQTTSTGGDVDLGAMAPETASALRGVWRALPEAPRCVVHGDLSSRNVLVGEDLVTILDWDEARVDVPWFDLAALPRATWPMDGDARLVRAAGLAWEVASNWTSDPAYARQRLLELRDEVSGGSGEVPRIDELHVEAFGRAVTDD